MKKIKKAMILVAVFFGVLCCSYFVINFEAPRKVMQMPHATLPVMYAEYNGERINRLQGYTQEMSAVSMRDTITPIDGNYQVSFQIDAYGSKVKSLSYELQSVNGKRTLSKGSAHLSDTESKDTVTASISFGSRLISDTDYLLILKLETDAGADWYYTRVAYFPDAGFDSCRDFVEQLFQESVGQRKVSLLKTALETENGIQASLQHVTIHSSLDDVCWKDFSFSLLTKPVLSVQELTNSYSSYVLRYRISHEEDGKTEYYNVREFYRVRSDSGRMYLLDYDRNLSRVFSPELEQGSAYINLGLRSSNVSYLTNEVGNIICFVQEGELWSYNTDSHVFTKVFSFSSRKDTDIRNLIEEHDIRILKVSETGNVDFAVYGYMNRGDHEGQCGIGVYHFAKNTGTVEELLFLPQTTSYYQMEEAAGGLMYLSDRNRFYFASGTALYRADLDTKKISTVTGDMKKNSWEVSEDGRYVAWTSAKEKNRPANLYLTDLEEEKTFVRKVKKGKCISPLGFMGSDCIYGTAKEKELNQSDGIFVMNRICIMDSTDADLKLIKSYHKKGIRYTGAEISQKGTISLACVRWENGSYVKTDSDIVKNRDVLSDEKIEVSYIVPDDSGHEIVLKLLKPVSSSDYTQKGTQMTRPLKKTTAETDEIFFLRDYYVYAKGQILLSADDAATAVQMADKNGGVVTDSRENYIWNRAKMLSQNKIILHQAGGRSAQARAVNVMLTAMGRTPEKTDRKLAAGTRPYTILKKAEGSGTLLNLTGCSLEEMLYYIGRGYPVYALLEGSHPVLLEGYTTEQVWYFDPDTGQVVTRPIAEASKLFKAGGNIYYAYQRQK